MHKNGYNGKTRYLLVRTSVWNGTLLVGMQNDTTTLENSLAVS